MRKSNIIIQLYIDYWNENNLIKKNPYQLQLISKTLDQLKTVKQFTQLNLISAYNQMNI